MVRDILFTIIIALFSKNIFANELTTWKCAIFPKEENSYAFIKFDNKKAILMSYVYLLGQKPSLLRLNFKFYGNLKNVPETKIYIHPENGAILAINTRRHLASGLTLGSSMPDKMDDNFVHWQIGNEKIKKKINDFDRTGINPKGYYCNIDQNTKMPEYEDQVTDRYDDI